MAVAPKLRQRIGRSRAPLDLLDNMSVSRRASQLVGCSGRSWRHYSYGMPDQVAFDLGPAWFPGTESKSVQLEEWSAQISAMEEVYYRFGHGGRPDYSSHVPCYSCDTLTSGFASIGLSLFCTYDLPNGSSCARQGHGLSELVSSSGSGVPWRYQTLTAAQDIIKSLSISYRKENDDHAKCEQLDYLYAAGLILIAAMRITCLMNGTQHWGSPTAAIDRSMTTVENDVRQVDHLLRYYQERCEQVPRLKRRMERCRDALAMIRLQSVSSSVITDNEITFCRNVWLRLYDRLSLDIPFQRFSHGRADNGKTTGRRMTFGWLESLPFDLDSQGE